MSIEITPMNKEMTTSGIDINAVSYEPDSQ